MKLYDGGASIIAIVVCAILCAISSVYYLIPCDSCKSKPPKAKEETVKTDQKDPQVKEDDGKSRS